MSTITRPTAEAPWTSYRYFFNVHNGIEANYGYSLNTQNYGFTSGALGVFVYGAGADFNLSHRFIMRAMGRHRDSASA